MAKATELLQGTLDLLILRTLDLRPLHGVGIADRIEQVTNGVFVVGPGSLFPALHRLAEKGWIAGEWKSAIGKRILVEKILPSRRGLGPETAWEIVGVVADEKGNGLENPVDIGAYASFAQNPVVGLGLVARGGGDGGALIKSLRQAVSKVNKDQVLDRAQTVEQMKTESMMSRRLTTSLLGGFALMALFLACAGIYGVLSFVTANRTQEMGIRAAMGATRGDLIRLVIGGGSIPVLAGLVIGLAGALALARFIQSMLFATDAVDIPTLASASGLFLVVGLAACFVPAWRAASVDPMTALREE
jgi:putative ABC transport system permease protein